MAKFVFTGDPKAPGQDPKTCLSYGLTFTLNGDPVEAPDEKTAANLRESSHFTEVGGKKDTPAATVGAALGLRPAPAVPTPPAPAFTPAPPARPNIDTMSTAELRLEADKRGINHEDMSKSELQAALR